MVTSCHKLCLMPFKFVAPGHRMPTSSLGIERECSRIWGDVSGDAVEILRAKTQIQLKQWIGNGDYVGWLAAPVDKPEMIVGGAGVQLQPILPRPLDISTIGEGRWGTIVNVFTEPQWRKRGIAGLLIKEIIVWSKNEQLNRLVLHASDEGRSIYERYGFVASNEMRFVDD